MTKSDLKSVSTILPFDDTYVLVGKKKYYSSKKLVWNLMDAEGKLISETWFASITKNTDGSIKTEVKAAKAKKVATATFISTASFAKASHVMDLVPVACLSLVDSGTIEPYKGSDKRYIAKAKLYGKVVFLDKDGNIYSEYGEKIKLLFNTVDSERIFNAVKAFNRKMHHDSRQCSEDDNSYAGAVRNKLSMWGFYWINDDWSVDTDMEELGIRTDSRKWTDDFIIRIAYDLVPEDVRKHLTAAFGKYDDRTSSGVRNWSWHLNKGDLEKLINTLQAA